MSINSSRLRPLSTVKQLVLGNKGPRPYRVYFGLFRNLVLNLDLQHQTQVYLGLYERETYKSINNITDTCKWMIDIGSGTGELCLYFLKNSQAEKIIGVEPLTSEIDILKSNLLLNQEQSSKRIIVLAKCVGTANHPNYFSLDDLELEKDKRGFIKIDVEGYEMDVLQSGERLLSSATVDLLVETHSKILEEQCLEWLVSKGYHCKVIMNAWWRVIVPEQRPILHNRWIWATNAFHGPSR